MSQGERKEIHMFESACGKFVDFSRAQGILSSFSCLAGDFLRIVFHRLEK
jgi:hypothetical protein